MNACEFKLLMQQCKEKNKIEGWKDIKGTDRRKRRNNEKHSRREKFKRNSKRISSGNL